MKSVLRRRKKLEIRFAQTEIFFVNFLKNCAIFPSKLYKSVFAAKIFAQQNISGTKSRQIACHLSKINV